MTGDDMIMIFVHSLRHIRELRLEVAISREMPLVIHSRNLLWQLRRTLWGSDLAMGRTQHFHPLVARLYIHTYITLHCIALHCIALHYTNYITHTHTYTHTHTHTNM